jgi:hypothetical protein
VVPVYEPEFYPVSDSANGNHKSGKDNKYKNWNISQKLGKYVKTKLIYLPID